MSDDPAAAIQLAVRATLLADPGMVAAFGGTPRIWDTVPSATPDGTGQFPYCTIGDDQVNDAWNQASANSETFVKVEVWSRTGDNIEVKTIAGAVRDALDAYIAIAGHSVIAHRFHGTIYRREDDGLTRRAIVTIIYDTQPAVARGYITAL